MKTAIKYTLYLGLALVVERINKRLEKRRIRSIRASDIDAGAITSPNVSASTITAKKAKASLARHMARNLGIPYMHSRRGCSCKFCGCTYKVFDGHLRSGRVRYACPTDVESSMEIPLEDAMRLSGGAKDGTNYVQAGSITIPKITSESVPVPKLTDS